MAGSWALLRPADPGLSPNSPPPSVARRVPHPEPQPSPRWVSAQPWAELPPSSLRSWPKPPPVPAGLRGVLPLFPPAPSSWGLTSVSFSTTEVSVSPSQKEAWSPRCRTAPPERFPPRPAIWAGGSCKPPAARIPEPAVGASWAPTPTVGLQNTVRGRWEPAACRSARLCARPPGLLACPHTRSLGAFAGIGCPWAHWLPL